MNKTCFKCSLTFPIEHFYKHPQMADGHLNKCKGCTKLDTAARYERKNGCVEYERERLRKPERKAAMKRYQQARRAREPVKYAARNAVSNAIRDGRLVRGACSKCGSEERVQGHHYDYSKPLDVEWLCFKCHREHAHEQTVRSAA
jgi:hypothetical protein